MDCMSVITDPFRSCVRQFESEHSISQLNRITGVPRTSLTRLRDGYDVQGITLTKLSEIFGLEVVETETVDAVADFIRKITGESSPPDKDETTRVLEALGRGRPQTTDGAEENDVGHKKSSPPRCTRGTEEQR